MGMDNNPFDGSHGYVVAADAVLVNDPYTHICCPAGCHGISENQGEKGSWLLKTPPKEKEANAMGMKGSSCCSGHSSSGVLMLQPSVGYLQLPHSCMFALKLPFCSCLGETQNCKYTRWEKSCQLKTKQDTSVILWCSPNCQLHVLFF